MLHRIRDSIIEYFQTQASRILDGKSLRSLMLFLVIFFSLVLGVTNAVRGIDRGILWSAIWIGLPLGLALAHPRLPGWLAALIASLLGILWTSLRVTDQIGVIGRIIKEATIYLWRTVWRVPSVDISSMQSVLLELNHAQRDLIDSIFIWLQANLTNQTLYTYDPLIVALIWGLILWALSLWAGWAIRRRQQPLISVLPAVGALALILAFVFGRIIYLMPMVVAMLMLKAQFEEDRRLVRWEQQGMNYASNISKEITRTAFIASSTLVIFAALIPSIYSSRIVEMVWNISQGGDLVQEITYALGLEPRSVSGNEDPFEGAAFGALPREHLINAAPELSDQVVMTVRIREFQPYGTAQPDRDETKYYWRGRVYETYTGRGWTTGDIHREEYDAGEKLISDPLSSLRLTRQEVNFIDDASGLIYVAGDLVTVDRHFQVAWQISQVDVEEFDDVIGASLRDKNQNSYRADSLRPIFGKDDLRDTEGAYPQWIVDRYLLLPDSVPERVHNLALELISDQTATYDRAVAIERYLRSFPYTLDVPSPPTDQDIADYFLFDLQKGYCDYYATSMVVMARAVGIPARLATGYIGGIYRGEGQYTVTEDLAHSWPQIYFPEFGWIDFEPTGGRAEIVRPEGSLTEELSVVEDEFEPILAQRTRTNWRMGSGIGLGVVLLFVGSIGIWVWADSWQLRRAAPNQAIEKIFRRMYRFGPRLELPVRQGSTPNEFSANLGNEFSELTPVKKELCTLSDFHNRAAYSQNPLTSPEQNDAIKIWLHLRRRLLLAWLKKVVNKIRYN